jgi:hypothetical protein
MPSHAGEAGLRTYPEDSEERKEWMKSTPEVLKQSDRAGSPDNLIKISLLRNLIFPPDLFHQH